MRGFQRSQGCFSRFVGRSMTFQRSYKGIPISFRGIPEVFPGSLGGFRGCIPDVTWNIGTAWNASEYSLEHSWIPPKSFRTSFYSCDHYSTNLLRNFLLLVMFKTNSVNQSSLWVNSFLNDKLGISGRFTLATFAGDAAQRHILCSQDCVKCAIDFEETVTVSSEASACALSNGVASYTAVWSPAQSCAWEQFCTYFLLWAFFSLSLL